jgi:hypothetical protein
MSASRDAVTVTVAQARAPLPPKVKERICGHPASSRRPPAVLEVELPVGADNVQESLRATWTRIHLGDTARCQAGPAAGCDPTLQQRGPLEAQLESVVIMMLLLVLPEGTTRTDADVTPHQPERSRTEAQLPVESAAAPPAQAPLRLLLSARILTARVGLQVPGPCT